MMIEKGFNPPEKQRPILQEIKNIIEESPEEVEDEFLKTANTWLDCFVSRLSDIEKCLNTEGASTEIGSERDYQKTLGRLEELKLKIDQLKEQYITQDTIPPDEIKEELFESLKNII